MRALLPKLAGAWLAIRNRFVIPSITGMAASTRVIKIRSCSALEVLICSLLSFPFRSLKRGPETNYFLCSARHFPIPKISLNF
jgi:hypothetical protein